MLYGNDQLLKKGSPDDPLMLPTTLSRIEIDKKALFVEKYKKNFSSMPSYFTCKIWQASLSISKDMPVRVS